MEVGTICQNFRVTRVRRLDELDCNLWEMEHIKTGAQLISNSRVSIPLQRQSILFSTMPRMCMKLCRIKF